MKLSRLHKMTAGVLIILTGIGLFLDSLNLIQFGLFDLWPLVLVYFGVRLWENHKRFRGGLLIALGTVIALDMWLQVSLFKLIIPILFIYFGFRLVRGRSGEKDERPGLPNDDEFSHARPEGEPRHWRKKMEQRASFGSADHSREKTSAFGTGSILSPKETRSSLIGDFHLTSGRFELSQMHIWHGIGGVVIDLSRAMLIEDEAFLVIDGWVGDVTIYVPVDMPVAVSAEVSVGDVEVFGHRQGGISRSVMVRSEQYEHGTPKIHVQISLLVGDIKVKYI
ncbi:cell wall-active antibiotics response protein [Brevibacillus composti]|uniref:Cell wall-active antibiotics response protein n=1 Tax=Brevibacillus composti TaxID=2796470 RepID=A0A7T5JN49_9BACL|nr:cell wall-active antibiotics response protein LiaF [Brevibacillus composti]QQE73814.1 cell wall-active antibiotics response protein [Brevibacillus composti]QUO40899.1 cell wall-active antibiotics response protein [Brevibacillus composti]